LLGVKQIIEVYCKYRRNGNIYMAVWYWHSVAL